MRMSALLIGFVLLAAAATGSHAAIADGAKARPAAAAKLPTGLRGSAAAPTIGSAATARGAAAIQALKPRLPLATPIVSAAPSPGQCRNDCAHSYYFCPSGPAATDCADTWSQCVVSCAHPAQALAQ